MSYRTSHCCCDKEPGAWYDVLWGGSSDIALVGVVVDVDNVYPYGFTDIQERIPSIPDGGYLPGVHQPTTNDKLRLGRFSSLGDGEPQRVTPGDSINNSYKTLGQFFNLQTQLTTLATHPDAVYKPLATGLKKGVRVAVSTMFDIGGGKTFCTLITDSVIVPGQTTSFLYYIVRACWIDRNGGVVDAWASPSPRERFKWGLDAKNIYRPDCPFDISAIYGEMESLGSYNEDEIVYYKSFLFSPRLSVAYLVDREGQTADWVTLSETYHDSTNPIPSADIYRIPGVPVSGIILTSATASEVTYESGSLSRTERLSLFGRVLPIYCAVNTALRTSRYNPLAFVQGYNITRAIISTENGFGSSGSPSPIQGFGVAYKEYFGIGRRVGPGTVSELDLLLYETPHQYQDTPFGFVTDEQGFYGYWFEDDAIGFTPSSEENRVFKHYNINGSPVTLETFNTAPTVPTRYRATKNTTVVICTHSLLDITIEAGAPATGSISLCTYDVTYDRTVHGTKLFCAVHENSGGLLNHTTAPVFSGSSTPNESIGQIAPFYSTHGTPAEIPNITLEPNALGKPRGVLQWGTTSQPGKFIKYRALADDDLRVFWGDPTLVTDARFVLNCRWAGTSTAGSANWYGSDLVFMRDAETILSVCRILGEVILFEATSQGIYLEQRIYEGGPNPRRTGWCFKRDGTSAFVRQLGPAIFSGSTLISSSPGLGDSSTLHPFWVANYTTQQGVGSTGTLIREHYPNTGTLIPDSAFTDHSWIRTAPPYTPPGQ